MDEKERLAREQAAAFMAHHPYPRWIDDLLSLLDEREKTIATLEERIRKMEETSDYVNELYPCSTVADLAENGIGVIEMPMKKKSVTTDDSGR